MVEARREAMDDIDSAVPDAAKSIRLAPGSHASPREGACVVELASMLAGEEFSDRPRCVCPVIAAFLRTWNDLAAYADRQRLRPYAARLVGTRGSRRTTRARRDACLEWVVGAPPAGWVRRRWAMFRARARIAIYLGVGAAMKQDEGAGAYAARVAFSRGDQEGAFELLDRLLASGSGSPAGNGAARFPLVGNRGGLPAITGPDPAPLNGNGSAPPNGRPAPVDDPKESDSVGAAPERL
jgi:hypothetical protein